MMMMTKNSLLLSVGDNDYLSLDENRKMDLVLQIVDYELPFHPSKTKKKSIVGFA